MAKSAWKFLKITRTDFYRYTDEFKLIREKKGLQNAGFTKNNLIINGINYMHKYHFHLGNSYTQKSFYLHAISFKANSFLKFKKPFSFRPKKKKKKTVKKSKYK